MPKIVPTKTRVNIVSDIISRAVSSVPKQYMPRGPKPAAPAPLPSGPQSRLPVTPPASLFTPAPAPTIPGIPPEIAARKEVFRAPGAPLPEQPIKETMQSVEDARLSNL